MGYKKRERDRLEGLAFLIFIIIAILCWPVTLVLIGLWILIRLFGFWL